VDTNVAAGDGKLANASPPADADAAQVGNEIRSRGTSGRTKKVLAGDRWPPST
jgi:hypothetical protein